MSELFTGINSGRGVHVVGVDSILDVIGSVLGPSIESLLVCLGSLGVGDRGTELGSLGFGWCCTG